jgi:hydrogenase maturation protease
MSRSDKSDASHGAPIRTIVVGLGSPHGDDQIGWCVAEEIGGSLAPEVDVRCVTVPIDLTHVLDGYERAILIDACRRCWDVPRIERWEWPCPEIALIRTSGTHAIGLPETLAMMERLGHLPREVIVWGIAGRNFSPGTDLTESLQTAIPEFASEIIERDLASALVAR